MKIAHICLTGCYTDGLSYQENQLTKYNALAGHETWMITSQWGRGSDNRYFKYDKTDYVLDGVHIVRLPIVGNDDVSRKFKRYYGLYNQLLRIQPDIVFIHNVQMIDSMQIRKYLQQNAYVTAYVDNHSDFSNSATNWLSRVILHRMIWGHIARSIAPNIKVFYGVLPARVDFLIDVYKLPKNKCKLLMMGADDELIDEYASAVSISETRDRYSIKKDEFLIVSGGKIDEYKWQTLLLMDAVNANPEIKVKLIVFGSVIDRYSEEIKTKCSNNVQYIGWVDNDESYRLFASCNLACFPGRHSVYWEQCVGQGIPLLVKDWAGTHHVDIGGNVMFMQSDSIESISGALTSVMEPEKYQMMLTIARSNKRLKYTYKEIAKTFIEGE